MRNLSFPFVFSANGPLKSYCYKRLTYLSSKFQVTFQVAGSRGLSRESKPEINNCSAAHDAQRDPGGGRAEGGHSSGFLQRAKGEICKLSNSPFLAESLELVLLGFFYAGGHTHTCCLVNEPEAPAQIHQEISQDRRQGESGSP